MIIIIRILIIIRIIIIIITITVIKIITTGCMLLLAVCSFDKIVSL
jgi:hypothetical protein